MKTWVSPFHGDRKKQFILICVLIATGFMALSLLNYQVSKSAIMDALVNRELPLTSENIYSEIQKDLVRPVFISSMMANDTFLKDWILDGEQNVDNVARYLLAIKEKYSAFSSFLVSESSRAYYHSGGILKKIQQQVPRDAWYFRVRAMNEPYEINVDPDMANQDAMTIFINHRVHDYAGKFVGVTGIGLTVASVSRIVEDYRQRYQRQVYFVDSSGKIILNSRGVNAGTKDIHRLEGLDGIADAILESGNGSYQYRSGGNLHLLNVRFIPELKWFIFVDKVEDEALQPLRRTLYLNLGACLLVTLMMIFLTNFTITYYQRRLEQMASTDALTGLANRHTCEILMQQTLAESRRSGKPFSVVLGDIDNFKQINDSHGHLTGDEVLREITGVLRSRLRESDMLCRWGGEEFLLLLKECEAGDAAQVAENLRTTVSAHFAGNTAVPQRVTISLGVAECQADESLDHMLSRADQAMYMAKNSGRDRVCLAEMS